MLRVSGILFTLYLYERHFTFLSVLPIPDDHIIFFSHLFPDFTLLFSAFSFIYFVFSLLASFDEAREPYSIRLFSLLAFGF